MVFTLGLMGVLAVSYSGGRWFWYSLSDYVLNALKLAGSMIARPFMFIAENRKSTQPDIPVGKKPGAKHIWATLRGVLIAIPILVIFAALLSSADLVFAQRVQDFVGNVDGGEQAHGEFGSDQPSAYSFQPRPQAASAVGQAVSPVPGNIKDGRRKRLPHSAANS